MDVKKLALLVGALVVAVITAVMAKNMFAGAGSQQAAAMTVPVGPKVLVAKKALSVGTIIDPDSFTFQPWPKELMQSAYYVEGQPDGDPKKLLGTVVRYAITAGQPVTRGSLVGPQDRGFLAAALAAGDVKVPAGANAADEKQMLLAIANRPIDSNTTFSTGGDVSRFQRRTVPAKPASASAGGPSGSGMSSLPVGPVVRIARGNNVT